MKPRLRIDKWLNFACLFKTRSQARLACLRRRVLINGTACKPGHLISVGDEVIIKWRSSTRTVRVTGVSERSLRREEARSLYEDLTPEPRPLPVVERIARVLRPRGLGRPTKKERRLMERLKGK